jgi:hypothetical protein
MLLGPCFEVSDDSEADDEDDGEDLMLTVAEHAMNVLFNYVRMVDKTSNI